MASSLSSPVGILTRLTHDNNHPLNSLFLWLVGPTPHWVAYRALAVICSGGTLVLTLLLSRRRGPLEAVASVTLMAASYPLVVYGSEARGYAPATFFALAAFLLLERARPPVSQVGGHAGDRTPLGAGAHGTICASADTTTSVPPAALMAGITCGSTSRGTAALTA